MRDIWKDKPALSAADGSIVFLIAMAVSLVLRLILQLILAPFAANETAADILNLVAMIVLQGGFFVSVYFYLKKRGRRPTIAFRPLKKWYNYVISLLAAGVVLAGFVLAATYFETFLYKIGYKVSEGIVINSAATVVLAVLATVICAPLFEELLMRGALLSGLTQRVKILPAVALSGLAFAMMHMNPEQTVYQFFLGAACAYLAIKAESLFPAILLHAGNNLIAVILTAAGTTEYAASGLPTANQTLLDNAALFVPLTVVAAGVAVALLYVIGRWMRRTERTDFETDAALLRESTLQKAKSRGEGFLLGPRTDRIAFWTAVAMCAVMWGSTFIISMGWV